MHHRRSCGTTPSSAIHLCQGGRKSLFEERVGKQTGGRLVHGLTEVLPCLLRVGLEAGVEKSMVPRGAGGGGREDCVSHHREGSPLILETNLRYPSWESLVLEEVIGFLLAQAYHTVAL